MWGMDPSNLATSIGARLPVRLNSDTRYFNDNFQALPKNGYSKMIENMLEHELITIKLNCEFEKGMEQNYDHAFLCCPIDSFFNFKYGNLPYRSIIFEEKRKFSVDLAAPVINFTDSSKYTRKTQWNLLPNCPNKIQEFNTVTYEIPCSLERNPNEHYYPIQTQDSKIKFEIYKKISKDFKNITFCGRTGLFKYIDMIPAVIIHMKIANDFLKKI